MIVVWHRNYNGDTYKHELVMNLRTLKHTSNNGQLTSNTAAASACRPNPHYTASTALRRLSLLPPRLLHISQLLRLRISTTDASHSWSSLHLEMSFVRSASGIEPAPMAIATTHSIQFCGRTLKIPGKPCMKATCDTLRDSQESSAV